MTASPDTTRLKTVLRLDAGICVVFGLVCAAAAGPIADVTALPRDLLFWAGLALLPVAALMAVAAAGSPPRRALVWFILIGNEAWIIGSAAILLFGLVQPNGLGTAFIIAQAVAVIPLVVLEYGGLKRSGAGAISA